MFQYIKALHIIFVVTWFAGLFYIVRLFIYHIEAEEKPEVEKNILQKQYKLMEKRLWYGITYPSAVITLVLGSILLYYYGAFPTWLILKLVFVAALVVYHLICGKICNDLQKNSIKYSSSQLRIWNEVATLLLVSIVFLVILQSAISMVWGIAGLVLFAILLMLAIKIYKKYRRDD